MRSFLFRRLQKRSVFFPIQILIFRMLRNNADVRRCSYLSLGYLCFPERKCIFLSLEENLWTINRKKEFPDFSLTLTISKIFPDLEKFWFSPDVSLTVATLVPGWYLRAKYTDTWIRSVFFYQRLFIIQVQNQYWQLVICIQNLLSHGIHSF